MIRQNAHTVEYKNDGNIVLSYEITKYRNKLKLFLIPAIILIILTLWEFVKNQTVYSLIIVLPLLFFFLYRWMRKTEKTNEMKEQEIIFENLNPIIKKDIVLFGETVKELERKYVIEEKDYSIGERYALVLLSNGCELRYNIINPKSYDKIQVLEIDVTAIKIK